MHNISFIFQLQVQSIFSGRSIFPVRQVSSEPLVCAKIEHCPHSPTDSRQMTFWALLAVTKVIPMLLTSFARHPLSLALIHSPSPVSIHFQKYNCNSTNKLLTFSSDYLAHLFILYLDPISNEFSFLVAFRSLTNLSKPTDGFNVISITNSAGVEEFSLHISDNSVQLTATVVEGPGEMRRPITAYFSDVFLNDRQWHRLAFSFEVCFLLPYFCFRIKSHCLKLCS